MNTLDDNQAASPSAGAATIPSRAVLEIDAANHPGVMSHVVSLFSRRAYNVEGILCLPVGDGRRSRIWLQVNEDIRLQQMMRQIEKLEDVSGVRRHPAGHAVFGGLGEFFQPMQE